MDDLENPTSEAPESVEGGDAPEIEAPEPEALKGNPAWESIRTHLDPISFSRIEPELQKFDQNAQKRIESVNEQFKPWKPFIEQGVQPELVQAALTLQSSLDSNPVEIYQFLGDFLKQTGRMPTKQEVEDAEESGELGGEPTETNPEIEQLREQQEQMRQWIESQAAAEIEKQAEADLDAEIRTFTEAHQDLPREDVKEILARAAFELQQTGKAPTLEEVHANWYVPLRTRFLSTPRQVDSAPRLLPTSGGVPSSKAPSLGAMSREDVQSIIANGISQSR